MALPTAPTVFIAAGEPSGDLHGAGLARALRARIPGVRILGMGGARMKEEGVELLAELDELSVMGFAEVVSRLPYFIRLTRRVHETLERERVDLVIPIDYPGFNLRLARHAKARGLGVLYYIAPQVWAWHASRAHDLARDTDRVAVILPFEADFLKKAGANAVFVGHPLLDLPDPPRDSAAWARAHGLDPARPVLALFPGSRAQELKRHLDLFCQTAAEVVARRPEVQPVIGASRDLDPALYAGLPWPRLPGDSGLLQNATAALAKSGTTTLEAALAGTPLVVAYRMNALSYQMARRLVKVPHIALANLVAGRRVAPEFVQHEATPEALSDALLPLLDVTSNERAAMVDGLLGARRALMAGGSGGAAAHVAEMAAELLDRQR
jgi:lipid-A-disaccharide synthase